MFDRFMNGINLLSKHKKLSNNFFFICTLVDCERKYYVKCWVISIYVFFFYYYLNSKRDLFEFKDFICAKEEFFLLFFLKGLPVDYKFIFFIGAFRLSKQIFNP